MENIVYITFGLVIALVVNTNVAIVLLHKLCKNQERRAHGEIAQASDQDQQDFPLQGTRGV